jgi:hypothetical protein
MSSPPAAWGDYEVDMDKLMKEDEGVKGQRDCLIQGGIYVNITIQ